MILDDICSQLHIAASTSGEYPILDSLASSIYSITQATTWDSNLELPGFHNLDCICMVARLVLDCHNNVESSRSTHISVFAKDFRYFILPSQERACGILDTPFPLCYHHSTDVSTTYPSGRLTSPTYLHSTLSHSLVIYNHNSCPLHSRPESVP